MKAFFIRQILPPVLVQLSIIVVLVYFEAKDFVPYVSPDEAEADFLAVLVLVPSVMLTWLWQAVAVYVIGCVHLNRVQRQPCCGLPGWRRIPYCCLRQWYCYGRFFCNCSTD